MAIFEGEIPEVNINSPKPVQLLPSPTIEDESPYSPLMSPEKSREGLSGDQLSKFGRVANAPFGWDSPISMISQKELLDNQRYPIYSRREDLENIYGLQQGTFAQLGNAAVKFAATTVGTFAQSFATTPNTINAIKQGDISLLSGATTYERDIDIWLKNLEDAFPNYYTRWEREHPFQSMLPFSGGFSNFIGDKVLKNLGFTAGAILGALAQDAIVTGVTGGIGSIPLISAQLGKASLYLNKIFAGANNIDKVLDIAKTADKAMDLSKLATAASTVKLPSGVRWGMGIYGSSRTEAAVEAREGRETVKEALIQEYTRKNLGLEPTGNDLLEIEKYADDAMNARFLVNMGLLTVSNTIQFGNLFKSFTNASRSVAAKSLSDLGNVAFKEGSIDIVEKQVAKTAAGRIWDKVAPVGKNMIAEGIYEEGGQFATDKGTFDYYTRKYRNDRNPLTRDTWREFDQSLTSIGKGLSDQFGTDEGLENMIIGAVVAMISGKISDVAQKKMGTDPDTRLNKAISVINSMGLTSTLGEQYLNTGQAAVIAAQMDEAAKSGDVRKYKNLKADLFFGFVQSRLPYGMHEVTVEQLSMLKDLSKEEFEKTFGMDFNNSNKATVSQYVDSLISEANAIRDNHEAIDATFKNPFTFRADTKNKEEEVENTKYKLFNDWKVNLVYYASRANHINQRISSIQESVNKINPNVDVETLSSLLNREDLKDFGKSYEEKAATLEKTITEYTSAQDKKRIRQEVKTLRTFSEKINSLISDPSSKVDPLLFNQLLNFELNGQDASKEKVVSPKDNQAFIEFGTDAASLINEKRHAGEILEYLSNEEGFNAFFEKEEQIQNEAPTEEEESEQEESIEATFENQAGIKETPVIGREYSIEKAPESKINKLSDTRWEVVDPYGNSTFFSTEEKAKEEAEELDNDASLISKVKVIGVNPDGSIKVEDKEGDIYDIPLSRLSGYEIIQTQQEKLQKHKEEIEGQQKEFFNDSSDVNTNSDEEDLDLIQTEDKRKEASELFISTTSVSEADPSNITSHGWRAVHFLQNVESFPNRANLRAITLTLNQAMYFGLYEIFAQSLGKNTNDPNFDREAFEKEAIDINKGLVLSVYVEQDGQSFFFVNQKGERITDAQGNDVILQENSNVDVNEVVFNTMPNTELSWDSKKDTARYRDGQKEEAEHQAKRWEAKRKELFAMPNSTIIPHKFRISRGIPVVKDPKDRNAVGELLVPEKAIATQEGLITIPTTGTITHQGKNINFPNGRPILIYGSTVQFLHNSKLSPDQVNVAYKVLSEISKEINENIDAGKPIELNKPYFKFLMNVFYYKAGKNKNNSLFIDTETMEITIGNNKFDVTQIESLEQEIKEVLSEAYFNINNVTLTKRFSEPFYEYYVDGKDNLQLREWKNYQSFLLASKNPDGSPRIDVPITTNVSKKSDVFPYTHQQKYAILIGMELPEVDLPKKKPEEKKPETPAATTATSGEFTTSVGVVKYNATDDGTVTLDATDSTTMEVLTKLSTVPASLEKATAFLKQADQFDELDTPIDIVSEYLKFIISAKIINEKKTKAPEAKKTDVEIKRQEVRAAIQKAGQGEGGQFTVTLQDGTKENAVRLSLVGNELGIGNKGVAVDLSVISKVENPDGTVLYNADVKPISSLEAKKAEIEEQISTLNSFIGNTDSFDAKQRAEKQIAQLEKQLADLQKPAIITSTPTEEKSEEERKPAKLKGVRKPIENNKFKIVGSKKVEVITDQEIELFRQWAKKNVPGIPFEVLENIIRVNSTKSAWGVFENGVAKFYKRGERGTEYHEVFEGVWAAFLTEEQRTQLLDEFKSKAGKFKDRETGKMISYDEATDQQAKERIADDFADFRLGKLPARSIGEGILNFFKSIIEFFKQFVSKPSKKEELFNAIDTGRFKDFVVPESVITDSSPEYRAVPGLSEQQVNELVEDMFAQVNNIIFGAGKTPYEIKKYTEDELFGKVKETYAIKNPDSGVSLIDIIGEESWNQLVVRTKDFLRIFKIEFDDNNQLSLNQEDTNSRDYAPEPFSTNWKQSSPYPVKILLSSLPETYKLNQVGKDSLEFPEPKESAEIGGYKLLHFGKAFSTIMRKLSGKTRPKIMVDALVELAKEDSNYVRLFTRIGGDPNSLEINYKDFGINEWKLFIHFYQTFTKQNPQSFIQYISEGQAYTQSGDLSRPIDQTKRDWAENIKALAKDKTSLIKVDSDKKVYKIGQLGNKPSTPNEMIAFLNKLGIPFTNDIYNLLTDTQKNQFAKTISPIYTTLSSSGEILSISGDVLQIGGPLSTLAELYVKVTNPNHDMSHVGVEQKSFQNNADNNAPSVFESEFNSVSTLDELLELRPELKDEFSQNSQVLKKGGLFFDEDGKRIRDVKVQWIEGTKNIDDSKDTTTAKLTIGNRITQEINQNVNGRYYILLPADSSTEWMMELGNTINLESINNGAAWNKIYSIFMGYLEDEIKVARIDKSNLKIVGDKSTNLRFFAEILNEKLASQLTEMLANDKLSERTILDFILKNESKINEDVKNFIISSSTNTVNLLIQTGQITEVGDKRYSYANLDSNFAVSEQLNNNNLSEKDLLDVILFANVNYIINNIEYHKFIFGDPLQFDVKNGKLDETKRIKSFLSPRRLTYDSPEYNTYLNNNYNTANGIELTENDYGYHLHKSHFNTFTFNDVFVTSDIAAINDKYNVINETDGFSVISPSAYREVKLKNAQWSDQAEEWYQWQMAYTRQNIPGYKYTNNKLKANDEKLVKQPEPVYQIEVLKPIVSGTKHNKNNIDLILDKFSQMPIFYKAVEGTNLEKIFEKMFHEKMDYGVAISGRKVGAESVYPLYTEDGSLNTEAFGNPVQIPMKAYGIQVENSYSKKFQTRGSQITKLFSLDMFANGQSIIPELEIEYKNNISLLDQIHRNSYIELLEKLGIEELDGKYILRDKVAVSNLLAGELLRRSVSENVKDIIRLDENGEFILPFEASASYQQIRDILYSMVDKAIISPKVNGAAHVQVPATLWESSKAGRKVVEIKGKKVYTSSELKFYTKEDPYCEVMLPMWFRNEFKDSKYKTEKELLDFLNTTEGNKILQGIGFRIPTQSMSSIETVRVKGFLPEFMGSTVVVPSEITTKAGSDFDIDKLNMYLKSVYVDAKGNIKLVELKGNEQETKDFYKFVFEETANKRIAKIEKLAPFRERVVNILEQIQSITQPTILDIQEALSPEDWEFFVIHDTKFQDIIDQASKLDEFPSVYIQGQIDRLNKEKSELLDRLNSVEKEEYAKEMYKKALENAYFESLEKMITHPSNFERLLSPVDKAGFDVLADELDKLKGKLDESKIKNRILDRNYMAATRHAFISGKKWVGIAAVNITGHSISQKSKVFINPDNYKNLTPFEQSILGDMSIALPHNSTDVDGQKRVSMSGIMTADGKQHISDRLSGYATAFVDIAKDPYILKIIKNELAIGTFMFLERIGAGNAGIYFMNQPIIEKYLEYLENKEIRWPYNIGASEFAKSFFPTSDQAIDSAVIDVQELKNNIGRYSKGEFKVDDNAQQHLILQEFLKYTMMASFSFKLTQAANYDTTNFRGYNTLYRSQIRTNIARTANIFSSVDNLLNTTHIGEQANLLARASEAMSELFKLDRSDIRNYGISPVLEEFAKDNYLSADNYDRVGNKILSSFIDYIVQTKGNLNSKLHQLVVDQTTNIASQLEEAKKSHPDIKILSQLEVRSSDRISGAKSVMLKGDTKEAYDQNVYIQMFRELKENPKTNALYWRLVEISLLQGVYKSPISIGTLIPVEDRAVYIAPLINTLQGDQSLSPFKQSFIRNNWKDDNIVSRVSIVGWPQKDQSGEIVEIPVSAYSDEMMRVYFFPAYGTLDKRLKTIVNKLGGAQTSERKLLFLNPKYVRATGEEFITVSRNQEVKSTGDRVDLMTGKTITKANWAIRKKKGDKSLNDLIGYQLVRHDNGTPLIIPNEDGTVQYVYKMINLWGDGMYAQEHYDVSRKSQIAENGSYQTDIEFTNDEIINAVESVIPPSDNYLDEDSNPDLQRRDDLVSGVINIQAPFGSPTTSILDMRNQELQYTSGQKEALEKIAKLIDSNKQGYFLLAGYAGTGKTTITENIAKYGTNSGKKIVILAPTNKAVKVLNDKLKSTKVETEAMTIHRAVYGEPDPLTGEWIPSTELKNSVIIVDESSMISSDVMRDLLDNSRNNNVVIFMGDSFQLEPVGEDPGLFKGKVSEIRSTVELTEVKRQSLDSNVLKMATLTRTDGKGYIPSESIEDFAVINDRMKFIEEFRKSIKQEENSVMIVATNNERIAMNNVARTEKYGKSPKLLEGGETLISVSNSVGIPNSEIFKLDEERSAEFSKAHNLTFTFGDKKATYPMHIVYVILENGEHRTMLFFPNFDKASLAHAQILKAARESNPEVYDFLNSDSYLIPTRKGPKLSPVLLVATYGYAITAHKSQGSQWEKVFVNQNYVAPSWNAARWYYTAITRASKEAVVLKNPSNIPISQEDMNSKLNVSSDIVVETPQQPVVEQSANTIYSQLGNKTKSQNVIFEIWKNLKNFKEAISPISIVSTRIEGTYQHFGNPFSHEFGGKLIKTDTIREAVEAYIDWVTYNPETTKITDVSVRIQKALNDSTLIKQRNWIREQLQSGKLKGLPILYYKELGEPSHATALDYLINNWESPSSQNQDPLTLC